MKLTGKCKDDFEKWIKTEMYYLGNEPLSDLFVNALIIEFFDSVGIYISVFVCIELMFHSKIIYNENTHSSYDFGFHINRQEATNNAIEKANLLYNEKYL